MHLKQREPNKFEVKSWHNWEKNEREDWEYKGKELREKKYRKI